jgi:serine/threonine-protein kinase
MQKPSVNRDLLFGILALQNGLTDPATLRAAIRDWSRDRARSLAQILVERGALEAGQRTMVDDLVRERLRAHGDDPESSLMAIGALVGLGDQLSQLDDAGLEAMLAHIGDAGPPTVKHSEGVEATVGFNFEGEISYEGGGASSGDSRFRVLRPHARGALGLISVALDTELNREVALKQIQPDRADDSTSRARFLLEAEVTGRLEHPGVVPVYSLGRDGGGQPYYAMRLVRGDTLKEGIEKFHDADREPGRDLGARMVALRELLRRFIDVCDAITYAHSRGVIHRDLKPANILLGPYGETLVVDWGLAKIIGREEALAPVLEPALRPGPGSGSSQTQAGSVVGTPAYMSPEQASGRLDELGPSSDTYSLGATLYCLLTGRPPRDDRDLESALRRAQRGEFQPPRQVNRTVPAALEAIVMKAMSPRSEERYGSPRDVAADLEQWMAGEPVSAWREPWTARARRELSRHRTLAASGAAAVIVAMAGLAAVLLVQARNNRRLKDSNLKLGAAVVRERAAVRQVQAAMQREININRDLTVAHAREQKARQHAQEQFALALDEVETSTKEVSDAALLDPALRTFHRKNLETALGFYKRLRSSLEGRSLEVPNARADLAMAYQRMATLSRRLGAFDDAQDAFRRAIAFGEALVVDEPTVVRHRRDLAASHAESGSLLFEIGRNDEGLRAYRRAISLWKQLARESPGPDGAVGLARTFHSLGYCYTHAGRLEQALEVFGQALAIRETLARDHPDAPQYRVDLAATLRIMGGCYSLAGRPREGVEAYRKAQKLLESHVQAHPEDLEGRSSLAVVINNIGLNDLQEGRPGQGLSCFRRNLAMHQELVKADPTNAAYREMLAYAYGNVGTAHFLSGQFDEALPFYREALALHEALAGAFPSRARFQEDVARIHALLSTVRAATGRTAEARSELREAERILEQVPAPSANTLFRLAGGYAFLSGSGGPDQRRNHADRAMATLRRTRALGWHDPADLDSDPSFAPLRSRPDFQVFRMDLGFPADPFAR